MRYQNKQISIWKKIVTSPVFWVVLLILIGLMASKVYEQFKILKVTSEKRDSIEKRINTLNTEKTDIETKLNRETNSYGIEEDIRKDLDMQREGEQVIVILEDNLRSVPKREGPIYTENKTTSPWYIFWR